MVSDYIRSQFSSLREYLTPVTHTSTFERTGEITPEEFVKAGDYLVYKFPTWQWCPLPPERRRSFLPPDKQYLVTRHVPSYVRAADYEQAGVEDDDDTGEYTDKLSPEEAWTSPMTHKLSRHCTPEDERRHSEVYSQMKESCDTGSSGASIRTGSTGGNGGLSIHRTNTTNSSISDGGVVNDIDELIDDDAEEELEDDLQGQANLDGEIINDPNKRSYDLYITYSTSYRVPKMYMVGFDSNGTPLSPHQMFEDIASDYRHKTVTIEKAPFLVDTTAVSIHPCRHSTVMRALFKMAAKAAKNKKKADEKDLVKDMSKLGLADSKAQDNPDDNEWQDLGEDESDGTIRVDQYLIIFLKFMASVTPGIEHDYTMDAL